ncbi:putative RNA-directed DNA polymerase from transposon X-element [Trichonephila clavipes]|nr:putative RNA-directed DNA polymerase from transposon X-element [Trichonephila clavipes]
MCADKESAKSNDENTVVSSSVLSNQSVNETVYLQTLVLRIEHNVLQLRPKSKQTVVHGLFGGRETSPHSHLVFDVYLKNFEDTYAHSIEVLSQKKICGFVPKIVDIHTLQELKEKNITLSDLEAKEHDIELLLEADVIGNILTDNSLKLSSGVTVVQTKLGYTVIGKTNTIHNSLCNNVVSLHCANFTVTDLWNLDAIGITDPTEDAKRKHAHFDFLNQFKENLSVLPDGRQWEDLQIIEEVPKTEVDNFGYYLPHRPVMKQASRTMKIRPVFDASARDKSQPSLNDCLNRGPNLIELIPDIIDRFRLYPIGLPSDIEKAFLQLSIIPEHRDYLPFFLPNVEESKIYRHCRVVFGICSSPFQLSACIDHLLENSPARFDDVTQKLKHSFYVLTIVSLVLPISKSKKVL